MAGFRERDQAGREPCVPSFQKYVLAESHINTGRGHKFWMGHAGENMSDLYDKIRQDMQFRREVVEKAGLGFEVSLQKAVVGPNGPKIKSKSPLEMAASA
jgi:hypothetical protein